MVAHTFPQDAGSHDVSDVFWASNLVITGSEVTCPEQSKVLVSLDFVMRYGKFQSSWGMAGDGGG